MKTESKRPLCKMETIKCNVCQKTKHIYFVIIFKDIVLFLLLFLYQTIITFYEKINSLIEKMHFQLNYRSFRGRFQLIVDKLVMRFQLKNF